MSYLKVSYLLKNKEIPPFVLGAFFSRSIIDGDIIYTEASSKVGINIDESILERYKENKQIYIEKLNKISSPFTWELLDTSDGVFKARLAIENDLGFGQRKLLLQALL